MRKFVECFDDACECVDCARDRAKLIDSEVCMKRQDAEETVKKKVMQIDHMTT